MAVIFSGVAAASVIGVPAGTYLSELLDWRTAFLVFAGFSGAVLAAIAVLVPAMPQRSAVRFAEFGAVLRRPAFRVVLAALGLTVLGHFAAYTFVTPALRDLADAGPALIGGLLLVYGAAGLVGNFAAPSFAARSLPGTVLGTTVLLAAAMAVFPSAVGAAGLPAAVLLLVLWGVGYGAVPATLQLWNLQVVKDEPEAGSALFVTVFQGSIAVGAALGGAVVDGSSPSAALWFGAALAGAAVLVVGLAGRRQR
jgi:predicted MFS family arabinose efflux permease